MKNYGWDEEHPVHVKKDWKYEVANDDTLLGYDEWVANKSEVETPHKAVIRWGSEMTREDNEGVSSSYSFETNIELEAFMRGVEEAIGWSDYELVENEGSVTNGE